MHLQPDALSDALVATLDDVTRVPAETLRRVACDATLVGVRADELGNVVEFGRRRRVVSNSQRRALMLRDRRCRFPGCAHAAWLDAHHVEHWAHGGTTTLGNLVLLCPAHHRLVHEGGFSIALGASSVLEVRGPDGALVPAVPPLGADASVDALRRVAAVSAGTPIDDETLRPWWDGRPPDLSACVAAGQRRAGTTAQPHPRWRRTRRHDLRRAPRCRSSTLSTVSTSACSTISVSSSSVGEGPVGTSHTTCARPSGSPCVQRYTRRRGSSERATPIAVRSASQ